MSAGHLGLMRRLMVAIVRWCGEGETKAEEEKIPSQAEEIVKVFPGSSVGGPDFVKSILGPMPWTRMMPTGGVEPSEESLRKWFGAGIVACGVGSNLITKKMLDAKDFKGIEDNVRNTIALVKRIKAELAAK